MRLSFLVSFRDHETERSLTSTYFGAHIVSAPIPRFLQHCYACRRRRTEKLVKKIVKQSSVQVVHHNTIDVNRVVRLHIQKNCDESWSRKLIARVMFRI